MPIKKPSKEEIDKTIEEIENDPEDSTEIPTEEDLEDEESNEEDSQNDDSEENEDTQDDEQEEQDNEDEDEDEPEPEKKTPSVEDRYRESTREAQVLHSKNKKFNDAVDEAAKINDVDEKELRSEYSDWDVMSETEQRFAKDNLINKKKFELIHQATIEGRKVEEWADKVDTFLEKAVNKPSFSRLMGKEDKFRTFAMKPSRRGVDLEDLAKTFLYDQAPTPATKKKKSLFNTGSGAKQTKSKSDGTISAEQAKILRTKKPKLYNKLVRQKKIKIEL